MIRFLNHDINIFEMEMILLHVNSVFILSIHLTIEKNLNSLKND
jgi:hypothetical protein